MGTGTGHEPHPPSQPRSLVVSFPDYPSPTLHCVAKNGLGMRLVGQMAKEPSRFMTIPNILGGNPADLHGRIVRTIGLLLRYDVNTSQIWTKDVTSLLELAVDSSMIEPFPFRPNALYQFIGELDGSGRSGKTGGVVLKAHAYRCVDKLDLDMYMQAHTLRLQRTVCTTRVSSLQTKN